MELKNVYSNLGTYPLNLKMSSFIVQIREMLCKFWEKYQKIVEFVLKYLEFF